MHAVRVTDLRSPLRRPLREGDRTALTVAGTGKIRTGDLVVFCKPVAAAAAVVRRDGQVQAGGHPADHARLGIIEQQLDEMTGQPGATGQAAAQARPQGKVKGTARRPVTMAAALRAVMLMALMPEAGYGEILAALSGDLPLAPWHAPFAVPAETVLATWRDAAGPEPVLHLQDMVPGASAAEHQEHDYRAISIGDLRLGSIDGSVTRMPDTPANRAESGSAGTSDDPAPCPQLRDLLVPDASTRGTQGIVTGPSGGDKAEAGQALLDRALPEYARVFTWRRLRVPDRHFPGVARIKRLTAVTHVLVRLAKPAAAAVLLFINGLILLGAEAMRRTAIRRNRAGAQGQAGRPAEAFALGNVPRTAAATAAGQPVHHGLPSTPGYSYPGYPSSTSYPGNPVTPGYPGGAGRSGTLPPAAAAVRQPASHRRTSSGRAAAEIDAAQQSVTTAGT